MILHIYQNEMLKINLILRPARFKLNHLLLIVILELNIRLYSNSASFNMGEKN